MVGLSAKFHDDVVDFGHLERLALHLGKRDHLAQVALAQEVREATAELGIPESAPVVGLVIPTGYSFNLDGTNIYMTMAALFIAQATNTPLTLSEGPLSADGMGWFKVARDAGGWVASAFLS